MADMELLLSELKMLLGIQDDEQNGILLFLLRDCISRILGYCRRSYMPSELLPLIPVMAVRVYRLGGYGSKDGQRNVSQVTQGDRTVAFEGGEIEQSDWLNDYKERLEPFRLRKGRLPSELDAKSGESI